ncbi:hypothetical protein N825_05200 [Skermanella stibiiresistens SB22]|uniref:Uncharacterized protein n=1 Tax=Skermanella stibiiresistens SB22 TaxID=1385369 RepID=W9GP67_9PROT|nr:DUF6290 family protein [Skermanella stibiiresistens]EWY35655.1 hypothetical protein N825_05200 [Skermanella stibiiresistens SB22]
MDGAAGLRYMYLNLREEAMPVSIRLGQEIEDRLEKLARATGRSKTYYIREAVLEHLDDLEDIHLAERELAEVRAGRSTTMSLDEMMKRYDLEG